MYHVPQCFQCTPQLLLQPLTPVREIKVEREPPTVWKSCPPLFPALQKETSLEKTNKGITHLQIKKYTYPVKKC